MRVSFVGKGLVLLGLLIATCSSLKYQHEQTAAQCCKRFWGKVCNDGSCCSKCGSTGCTGVKIQPEYSQCDIKESSNDTKNASNDTLSTSNITNITNTSNTSSISNKSTAINVTNVSNNANATNAINLTNNSKTALNSTNNNLILAENTTKKNISINKSLQNNKTQESQGKKNVTSVQTLQNGQFYNKSRSWLNWRNWPTPKQPPQPQTNQNPSIPPLKSNENSINKDEQTQIYLPTSSFAPMTEDNSGLPPLGRTEYLPNPVSDLSNIGIQCLNKCKNLGGISCKKWDDNSITCCEFLGCQWPFYCRKDKIIKVDGCQNKS